MGCERYEEALTDAAIGSLISPDLERHLALCAVCRGRLEGERQLLAGADRVLRDGLRVEPSPGFEARLLWAVRHAPGAGRSSWPVQRWAPALAAALGFLLVGGGLAWRWSWLPSSRQTAAVPAMPSVAAPRPSSSPRPAAVEPDRVVGTSPRPATRPRPSTREPEVLVPPGREQALAQFVAMLRDERVKPPKALTEANDTAAVLPELEPLEIPDLQPEPPSDAVLRDGRSES